MDIRKEIKLVPKLTQHCAEYQELYGLAVGIFTMLSVLKAEEEYVFHLNDKCKNLVLKSFFISIKDDIKIMSSDKFKNVFKDWLTENYDKFNDYWNGKEKLI